MQQLQRLLADKRLWTGIGFLGLVLYHALTQQDLQSAVHDFLLALAAWGLRDLPGSSGPGSDGRPPRIAALTLLLIAFVGLASTPVAAAGPARACCPCECEDCSCWIDGGRCRCQSVHTAFS